MSFLVVSYKIIVVRKNGWVTVYDKGSFIVKSLHKHRVNPYITVVLALQKGLICHHHKARLNKRLHSTVNYSNQLFTDAYITPMHIEKKMATLIMWREAQRNCISHINILGYKNDKSICS